MIPALTIFIAATFILIKGFYVTNIIVPVIACTGLLVVSRAYQFRAPNFTLCLSSLAALVSFSTAFAMAMDAAAPCGGRLWDAELRSFDSMLGLSAPATKAWLLSGATWAKIMEISYFSAIPQTILAILFFGLSNNPRLKTFLTRYMGSAVAVLIVFALFPARGSYENLVGSMNPCRDRFDALYSGAISVLDPTHAQGIITFPSFHTVWAVLLIVLFWPTLLRLPVLVLNLAMILSTIPIGCHYFADILGGVVVALFSCWLVQDEVRAFVGPISIRRLRDGGAEGPVLLRV